MATGPIASGSETTVRGEVTRAHHRPLGRPFSRAAFHAGTVLLLGGCVLNELLTPLLRAFTEANADAAAALAEVGTLYAVGEVGLLLPLFVKVALPAIGMVLGALTLLTLTVLAGRWAAVSGEDGMAPGVNVGEVSFTFTADILTVRFDHAVRRFRWRDLCAVTARKDCTLLTFASGVLVIVPARADDETWRPLFRAAGEGMEGQGADAALDLPTGKSEAALSMVLTPYDQAVFTRHVARGRNALTATIERLNAPQAPYLVLGALGVSAVGPGETSSQPLIMLVVLVLLGANWTRFFGRDALEQAWGLCGLERHGCRMDLTVTARGLVDDSSCEWSFYGWDAFTHVVSTRDGVRAHLAPSYAILLPSHAFASAEEQQEWKVRLEERIERRAAEAPGRGGLTGPLPNTSTAAVTDQSLGPWGPRRAA